MKAKYHNTTTNIERRDYLTKEERDSVVIKLYNSGLSFKSISEELKGLISNTTAYNIIKRHNIPTRNNGGVYKLDIKSIESDYKNAISVEDIALKHKVNKKTIYNYLNKNGITIKTMGQHHNPFLLDGYFTTIDSQRKAYLLGFLITDGSVGLRDNSAPSIRLSLQSKDEYILEEMKKEVKSSNVISRNENKGMSTFSIHSHQMFEDLASYGVVPNKALKTFLPEIDTCLQNHLLRGIFDGDGWVSNYITNKEYVSNTIGLCGSKLLMTQVRDVLSNNLGVYRVKVIKTKTTHSIQFSNKQDIIKIRDFLYKDSDIHLHRKIDKLYQ